MFAVIKNGDGNGFGHRSQIKGNVFRYSITDIGDVLRGLLFFELKLNTRSLFP